ncbi:NAD-dependent epimerase/dehydratase family protein [Longispora albida]|uniref:NAD-dependent epimerase/dehydratase family protein n=1 Tax=Longispora albida TaxID=203523 RepID=UPI000368E16B|nr:NAD-dependent epimerase/dehydratase family protein [Longispora albida]
MKVLVLGASGYIGSAVTARLIADGHEVIALVRTGTEAPAGLEARFGDLADPDSLRAAVTPDLGAVLNLATPTGDEATDVAAMAALLGELRGTGRAFVYTSGIWVLGATGDAPATEDSPASAIPIVGYRPRIEQQVLAAAAEDVRAVVIRPAIAYGKGGGIPGMMTGWARENGTGRYVGDAGTRWPMVHVDDLAALFSLAVEKAAPGSLYHGSAHDAVSTAGLAAVADIAAGGAGRAEQWPYDSAALALGAAFAEALALSQTVPGSRAQSELGWQPVQPHPLSGL